MRLHLLPVFGLYKCFYRSGMARVGLFIIALLLIGLLKHAKFIIKRILIYLV